MTKFIEQSKRLLERAPFLSPWFICYEELIAVAVVVMLIVALK